MGEDGHRFPGAGSQSGIGDLFRSVFFSPKAPTAGGWICGAGPVMLANHVWSFAGDSDRADIDATFMQPFLSYTTPQALSLALNTESTYDWENEQWSVPINATATKVMKIGNQLVSIGGGVRYWVESSKNDVKGWGLRLQFTLLYPNK